MLWAGEDLYFEVLGLSEKYGSPLTHDMGTVHSLYIVCL